MARIEELSKKLGTGHSVNIDIRKHGGPQWTHAPGEHGPRASGATPPPTPAAPPAPPSPPIGMSFDDDDIQQRMVWISQNDDSSDGEVEEVEIEISK